MPVPVYFEAGFAMSKELKVLLTCRSDHFSPKSNSDPCVHFDINHRKIIEWSDPNDKTFSKRLESHARAVTRPLFERIEQHDDRRRQETEFARLPVKQRLNSLFQDGVKMLRAGMFEPENDLSSQRKQTSGQSNLERESSVDEANSSCDPADIRTIFLTERRP
jgi:hypothetical protein